MAAENRQYATLAHVLDRLRGQAPVIARDVSADLGAGVTAATVEPVVQRFLGVIATGGVRIGQADLVRLRAEGAAVARRGEPLAAPIDAYLSTAWVAWDHVLALGSGVAPHVMGPLGAALLRAGDDIVAALADGYTAAERALAARAGATRQAILEELLTPGLAGPAAVARLVRRATRVGFEPGSTVDLLVVRPAVDLEAIAELAQELERRLARDPTRRPHLVAPRGPDVVAIAGSGATSGLAWRADTPFADQVTDLAPGSRWWAVVAGPMSLVDIAGMFAAATDGLRVAVQLVPSGRVTPLDDLSLERALVSDAHLAAAGVDRWLGPIAAADRGGPELIRTLEAWLVSEGSIMASARALGVAPRTVSYRLERIAHILGQPSIDAGLRERLSTAMFVRRLLRPAPEHGLRTGDLPSNP